MASLFDAVRTLSLSPSTARCCAGQSLALSIHGGTIQRLLRHDLARSALSMTTAATPNNSLQGTASGVTAQVPTACALATIFADHLSESVGITGLSGPTNFKPINEVIIDARAGRDCGSEVLIEL